MVPRTRDFERRLYRKRNKVQVRFVELTDTIPIQGPEREVLGSLDTSDFLALLDSKHREIVILLSSGYRQHRIAELLGYANHSPVSKKLAQIRHRAQQFFDLDTDPGGSSESSRFGGHTTVVLVVGGAARSPRPRKGCRRRHPVVAGLGSVQPAFPRSATRAR